MAELVFRVLDLMPAHGLDREVYFERVYEEFADPAIWAVYPDTVPALAALAGSHRLGVISNFDGRLHRILEGLELTKYFEHVIISSEVGVDKPQPRIFQIALERFGVVAEQALHVGDSPVHDWEGAAAVGMHVFRLHRPENSLMELREWGTALPTNRPLHPGGFEVLFGFYRVSLLT
ncbi:MAG: HAD-IA family hydrolase, partial [Chthoniobacteraceae bacterium]